MKLFMNKKELTAVALSIAASFLFVAAITTASTTINSNVNTGGTLTVSGASTLTGAVWATSTLQATGAATFYNDLLVDTNTFYVDSTNNRVGIGSTTPAIEMSVAGDGYLTGGLGLGERNAVDKTLVLSGMTSNPTGAPGMIYYNSTNGNVRLYNGSSWGVIGTSTGFNLTGNNIQFVDNALNNMTLGTTTSQSAAMITLEATTTTAVPLVIVGRASQTGNLLQITANGGSLGGGSNLFTIDNLGRVGTNFSVNGFATTTAATGAIATQGALTVTGTSTLTTGTDIGGGYTAGSGSGATINSLGRLEINDDFVVNGKATTTSAGAISTESSLTVKGASTHNGSVTLGDAAADAVSIVGNASTTNNLTIGDNFWVNGNATTTSAGNISTQGTLKVGSGGSTITDMVFGICNFGSVTISASSTGYVDCAGATGITTSHKSVFVTATSSLPVNFVIQAASSSATGNINVRIFNRGGTVDDGSAGGTAIGARGLSFIGIR